MTEIQKGKWLGGLFVFCGIFAFVSGKAGWTLYGRLDGDSARIVGVIMVVFGFFMIFPKKSKKVPPRNPDGSEEKRDQR